MDSTTQDEPVGNAIVASGSIARAKSRTLTGKVSVLQKSGQFRYFDAIRQVREDRSLSANAKHVARVLAEHVNHKHDGCSFPSLKVLAGETSLCERSVRNAVRELERERWILTLRSPGKRSNRYRLTYGRASQPGTWCRLTRHHVPPNYKGTTKERVAFSDSLSLYARDRARQRRRLRLWGYADAWRRTTGTDRATERRHRR